MSNLKTYKFNTLYDFSSGISSKPEQAGHGFPFVSFSTVFNKYFLPEEIDDLMDTSIKEQHTYSILKGDILLTRTSETVDELAMSCVAIKDYPKTTYSGFVKRLRPLQNNITYDKYMGFYLRSKLFRKTMENNAVMTLRASLNTQIFSYLNLILPSYDEQVKIGNLLYSINKKIELNTKINQELEAMGRSLYNYWFIQFDFPNADNKPYKSSGGEMLYSEELKREIPEGWETKTLDEYADVTKGTLITKKETMDGNIKVVSAGVDYSYSHSKPNRSKNTITISASGANAGYINFWRESIFACDCTTIRGNTDIETIMILNYLYLLQSYIYSQAKGSAQPHVYPSDMKVLNYPIPNDKLVEKYKKIVLPINEKIACNEKENQKLSEIRDWLLPMLMNGQVKVADHAKETR